MLVIAVVIAEAAVVVDEGWTDGETTELTLVFPDDELQLVFVTTTVDSEGTARVGLWISIVVAVEGDARFGGGFNILLLASIAPDTGVDVAIVSGVGILEVDAPGAVATFFCCVAVIGITTRAFAMVKDSLFFLSLFFLSSISRIKAVRISPSSSYTTLITSSSSPAAPPMSASPALLPAPLFIVRATEGMMTPGKPPFLPFSFSRHLFASS